MPVERNAKVLAEMRKKLSGSTREDILNAIIQLKKSRKPINKSSVAKQAGCSRTTIYKHPDIVEQIEGIEARVNEKRIIKAEESGKENRQQRDDRIKNQYDKIKQLERDLHLAMIQLVKMEDLRRDNVNKAEVIERLMEQKRNLEQKVLDMSVTQSKEITNSSNLIDFRSKTTPYGE